MLAAAFYGAADFFGALASKRSSVFAVVILSQIVGFALLCVALPFFPGRLTPAGIAYGAAGGICGGVGIALLYHALSIGKMGVVSPITAVLAATVPVLVGVFGRAEHLSARRSAGIAVVLVAVVLISLSRDERGRIEFSTAGVREAIASGIALSGFYVFLAFAGKSAGLYPLVAARLSSALLLFACALAARRSVKAVRATVPLIVFAGTLDTIANALYVFAVYAGYLAVAAVLTSLYPAGTVFLARVVLGERLAGVQKAGVACALLGVALIAL